jgi:hypothetical protein
MTQRLLPGAAAAAHHGADRPVDEAGSASADCNWVARCGAPGEYDRRSAHRDHGRNDEEDSTDLDGSFIERPLGVRR